MAYPVWLSKALFWPTFVWNWTLGRSLAVRNWWDQVDENVILGAMPMAADAQRLYDEGVRGVINMCDEYDGPLEKYQSLGIEQLHLPTIDFQPPTLEMVERGVDFLKQYAARGEIVYVHCKAGRARSATVVLCYLVDSRGMTAEEAQKHLLKHRPHVHASLVERDVVKEFVARRSRD